MLGPDLTLAGEYFRRVESQYFGLTTLRPVAITNDSQNPWLMQICERVDDVVSKLPGIGPRAWMLLMTLIK